MWNTVLFDLDGTLTESGEGIMKSAQYALHLMGIEVADYNDLRSFVGPPLVDSFKSYAHLNDENAQRAVILYRQRFVPTGIYENRLYDGITDCLETLKQKHFTLAVASSKPEDMVWKVLRYFHIEQYFTAVVGSFTDGRRSDKAAVIEECIRELGMTELKDEIVYVGDRKYDITGAQTEGIANIGVLYGYGGFEELRACRPTLMADSPAMLTNILINQKMNTAEQIKNNGYESVPERKAALSQPYESVPGKIWRIIYPILIHLGISLVFSTIFSAIFSFFYIVMGTYFDTGGLTDEILNTAVPLTGFVDAVTLPIMYFLYKKDEVRRKTYAFAGGFLRKTHWNALTIVMSAVFVTAAAIMIDYLIEITGLGNYSSYQQVSEELYSASIPMQIVVLVIIGPLLEEMLFRGVIFRRLRDYIKPVPAIVISGLLFGIYHGNLVQGIFASLFGMLLALLYERFGTIWVAVAGHMLNNLYAVLGTAYLPNDALVSILINVISLVAFVALGYFLFFYKHPFRKTNATVSGNSKYGEM